MSLYKKIDECYFRDSMGMFGRDNFSLKGYRVILEHFEEYDHVVELDPIAIDCCFVEYDLRNDEDASAVINDYGYLVDKENPDIGDIIEVLEEETFVLCADEDCLLFDRDF